MDPDGRFASKAYDSVMAQSLAVETGIMRGVADFGMGVLHSFEIISGRMGVGQSEGGIHKRAAMYENTERTVAHAQGSRTESLDNWVTGQGVDDSSIAYTWSRDAARTGMTYLVGRGLAGGVLGGGAAGTIGNMHNARKFPKLSQPPTNTGNHFIKQVKGRTKTTPDLRALGEHSVFQRDVLTRKVTRYETFRPQTNPYDPKLWESVKRFDAEGASHLNKFLKQRFLTPHVHDPHYPGGVRTPLDWEFPN